MQPLRGNIAAALIGASLLLLPVSVSADAINDLLVSLQVPAPQRVYARSAPLRKSRTELVPFETAPFPYDGLIAGTDKPFLDVEEDGRRGHKTPFGRLYWEDETYSDSRVLLHIPKGFDVRKPSVMIVFFHGHGATLRRDVLRRQRVPAQITASGVNAVLVAPQLAVNAADSSAGKFWEPGAFRRFIDEAAAKLAALHGDRRSIGTFDSMPIVLVAYSGGYLPAAWCASKGGLGPARARCHPARCALWRGRQVRLLDRARPLGLFRLDLSGLDRGQERRARARAGGAGSRHRHRARAAARSRQRHDLSRRNRRHHQDQPPRPRHACLGRNPVADLLRRLRQYRR